MKDTIKKEMFEMNAKIIEFKSISKEEKSKMEKLQKQSKMALKAFTMAFGSMAADENTIGTATVVGLYQGLKYNGSLGRGVKAGVVTLVALSTVGGLANIHGNWDVIKNVE